MHHDQSTHVHPLFSKVLFYSAANMSDVIVCKFTYYFHGHNQIKLINGMMSTFNKYSTNECMLFNRR